MLLSKNVMNLIKASVHFAHRKRLAEILLENAREPMSKSEAMTFEHPSITLLMISAKIQCQL